MKKIFAVLVLLCLCCFAGCSKAPQDVATQRIKEIRTTKNTDVSKRLGKTYYVSVDGDDTANGLSPQSAWKTIQKVNEQFANKKILPTDSVLFRRGDVFRGSIRVHCDDVLLGSFGEQSAKPQIYVSPWDGTQVGEWTKVDTNIWQYTVNGENPFAEDVGEIWFICNNTVLYGEKVITPESFDESSLNLKTLLNSDLKFYHTGHPYAFNNRAQQLYVYSETNPAERFSQIEFATAKCGISLWNYTDTIVDNLDVRFVGIHGVSAGTVANLQVSNCEFSYIGGAVQKYENNKFVRYGNGVEVYGSVTETNGYKVKGGYIVQNNYVHDVYDAGITFQLSTDDASPVEKVVFKNNVVERCVYSIEYWNNCWSKDEQLQTKTYINNFSISNNVLRQAGFGVCSTRPDKNQSAHIKTWKHNVDNLVTGAYVIENNIFDTAAEHVFYIYAVNEQSLPKVVNNKFYNSADVAFGYVYFDKKIVIPYDVENLSELFPNNTFYLLSD